MWREGLNMSTTLQLKYTASETGGNRKCRDYGVPLLNLHRTDPGFVQLATALSSASYKHTIKRKERGKEKKSKMRQEKARGKANEVEGFFQAILVSDEIRPDLQ